MKTSLPRLHLVKGPKVKLLLLLSFETVFLQDASHMFFDMLDPMHIGSTGNHNFLGRLGGIIIITLGLDCMCVKATLC